MRSRLLPLLCLLGAAPLAAQRAPGLPIELGVDAAVVRDDATDVTTLSIPLRRLRAGFFLSPLLSLEPTLAYERASDDDGSASGFAGDLGLVAHLTGQPVGRARTAGLFVRPFVGVTRFSFSSDEDEFDDFDESATQASVGVGLGFKLPVADRLAWRLEGTYARALETDDFPAANRVGLNVGLSFHTR